MPEQDNGTELVLQCNLIEAMHGVLRVPPREYGCCHENDPDKTVAYGFFRYCREKIHDDVGYC